MNGKRSLSVCLKKAALTVLAIALGIAAVSVVPSMASAATSARTVTLSNVLPGGMGTTAAAAKANASRLLANDAGVDQAFAIDNHLSVSQVANAKIVKVTKGVGLIGGNITNTGRASNGTIVKTSYDYGHKVVLWNVRVAIVIGKKTVMVTFSFIVSCGNLALHLERHVHVPVIPVRKAGHVTINFSKSTTSTKNFTCPSGQAVVVKVVTKVASHVYVKSLTEAITEISNRLTAQIKVDVRNTISITCKSFPKPAPAPVVISCPAGTNQVGASCIAQTNTATVTQPCTANQVWNGVQCVTNITQTNIVVVANCSSVTVPVGDNNVVYQNGDNCNTVVVTSPPPPTPCPSGSTGSGNSDCTPLPCAAGFSGNQVTGCVPMLPTISIVGSAAHMFNSDGDSIVFFVKVLTLDGSTPQVASPVASPSTLAWAAGFRQVDTEQDGVTPCATGYTCYEGTLWAQAGQTGTLTLTATAVDPLNGAFAKDAATLEVYPTPNPNT